jgi:L(+)-tartrate dehydratase beta subunit
MANVVLHTPIKSEDIENLKIGDIVYLTGHITTCRDVAHRRLIEEKRELPVDLKGGAIFHAGPIVRPIPGEKDKFEMVSIGPTTSMRMEKFEKEFIEQTGVKLIVGKGGMGEGTREGCMKNKCIFCVFPAGCAVVSAVNFKKIIDRKWEDLGMPETLWTSEVENLGPLIVAIDTKGNNLFEENKKVYRKRAEEAYEEISKHVKFIK